MSLNSSMKLYELWEKVEKKDKWGASTQEETLIKSIKCSINTTLNSNLSKDINYSEITHLGLTKVKGLKKGQILKRDGSTYMIDKVPNEITRFVQLYLKEVV